MSPLTDDPWAAAYAMSNADGEYLKYSKGVWESGREGRPMNGKCLTTHMLGLTRAWQRWEDKKLTDERARLFSAGGRIETREELGDLDQNKWKTNSRDEPKDPWQYVLKLPLVDQETGEMFLFSIGSHGGKKAIMGLASQYYMKRPKSPIVVLETSTYKHPEFGITHTPVLRIVDWTDDDAAPAIAAPSTAPALSAPANASKSPAPVGGGHTPIDDDIPF
jgi:hypothetical protein